MTDPLEARRRANAAARRLVERLVGNEAPAEVLDEAVAQLDALADRLGEFPYARTYADGKRADNLQGSFLENSPFAGPSNALSPYLVMDVGEGVVTGRVTFGGAYEGPPNCVHGGFIAAMHDEILGVVNGTKGTPGLTGSLTVRYRKPTPLRTELRLEATLDRVEGRRQYCSSRLYAGDVLCNEAEGTFVTISSGRFEALRDHRPG